MIVSVQLFSHVPRIPPLHSFQNRNARDEKQSKDTQAI